ncbi:MAG: hypothetical protein WBA05_14090 [Gordonia sp. (in: high G+C Gram-positive bacteria)]
MDKRERLPGRGPARSYPCDTYHPKKVKAAQWVRVADGEWAALCQACVRSLTPSAPQPMTGETYWQRRDREKGKVR